MSKQDKKELRQQIACEWLENNYLNYGSLRHDVVTDRLQIRDYKPTPAPSLNAPHDAGVIGAPAKGREEGEEAKRQEVWRNLTDKDINTMVCNCVAEAEVNISVTEMWTALKSDMVPSVHPIRAWLEGLKPYTPDQPDWIDWLAQQVKVKPSGEEAKGDKARGEEFWRMCFKKWFVAMVASWMKDEVVNHTVLVLIGRQGIFKTTWLERLIPPELREYSSKLPLSGQITKDDRLRLCENAMLNIDELDAICGREMNIVKSLLTSTDVNERAAYGRLKERRVRLASFCASTNNREFLTDITGNRRWLPFEVESIQSPFTTILPYERMYAQAWALAQDPFFSYWFDLDEIDVLEQHNQHFRDESNEEQLLPILFDVPAEGKGEFLTTAQISERLITYGNIKKPMALSRLGMLLGAHGFQKKTIGVQRLRGWLVYQRSMDEINANKRLYAK